MISILRLLLKKNRNWEKCERAKERWLCATDPAVYQRCCSESEPFRKRLIDQLAKQLSDTDAVLLAQMVDNINNSPSLIAYFLAGAVVGYDDLHRRNEDVQLGVNGEAVLPKELILAEIAPVLEISMAALGLADAISAIDSSNPMVAILRKSIDGMDECSRTLGVIGYRKRSPNSQIEVFTVKAVADRSNSVELITRVFDPNGPRGKILRSVRFDSPEAAVEAYMKEILL